MLSWKTEVARKPLLIRGARQVGKSYTVEKFGNENFSSVVTVNFEFNRKFIRCFDSLDPLKIINAIRLVSGEKITPGETLLFLDEIQECPNAILALRYFKEKMPSLHVIAAGSLLEFTLNKPDFRMPVGRIQSLFMKPCSFEEFLIVTGRRDLSEYLSQVQLGSQIETPIHETLLDLLREYFILGGMPEVVSHYVEQRDHHQCQIMQASLLEFYQRDFGKYDGRINIHHLQNMFDKIPALVAKNFKYVNVDSDVQSRELKPVLQALIDAGLVYPVHATSASGLPFSATMNERKFKLLFVDVGLVTHTSGLDSHALLDEHLILLNRGALAEQFVGQELLAYSEPHTQSRLFYWEREKRGSMAEVDYVTSVGTQIVPLEVKAGKTGRLKSLQLFLEEKRASLGIHISQNQFAYDGRVLSIPLYMIHEIPRLVEASR